MRLIFQPGEETTPGGSVGVVAAGARGRLADLRPALRSTARGRQDGHTGRPDHFVRCHAHGPAVLSRRPFGAPTSDGGSDLRCLRVGDRAGVGARPPPRRPHRHRVDVGPDPAGRVHNAIPESGELVGTLRSASHRTWATVEPLVRRAVTDLLAPYGVEHELEYVQGVPPVVNDPEATAEMISAIQSVVGLENLAEAGQSSGGEDFAWYLEHVPGAMARLGVWDGIGPRRDLHTPDFDLDERALVDGVRTFLALAYGGDVDRSGE
ncbi:M20/M25/M40 family metallo-hydrolase [Rhodococcus hoagii]|nr:M20/M25/M40 family metallo-hydrolase [Prescottella equi]